MKLSCHSELVSESDNMTYLPPHPNPLPQGAREQTRVAFTLAEVLITLGIIGVVAAMTIPNLITAHQKKATVTKLQKAISVINQAYRLSYDEVGELSIENTTNLDSQAYFNTYWAPYIKVSTYCKSSGACGYKTNTPLTYANNTHSTWYPVEPRLRSTFMTPDGYIFTIFLATWKPDTNLEEKIPDAKIFVDINGASGPNKYGKDVFWLTRVNQDGGGVRPYGYELADDAINADCSKNGNGEYCAEKIKRAGWQIEKDYPW